MAGPSTYTATWIIEYTWPSSTHPPEASTYTVGYSNTQGAYTIYPVLTNRAMASPSNIATVALPITISSASGLLTSPIRVSKATPRTVTRYTTTTMTYPDPTETIIETVTATALPPYDHTSSSVVSVLVGSPLHTSRPSTMATSTASTSTSTSTSIETAWPGAPETHPDTTSWPSIIPISFPGRASRYAALGALLVCALMWMYVRRRRALAKTRQLNNGIRASWAQAQDVKEEFDGELRDAKGDRMV